MMHRTVRKALSTAALTVAAAAAAVMVAPTPPAEAASYCYGTYINNRTASWQCVNTVGSYRAVGRCQYLIPFWQTRTVYGSWERNGAPSWVSCNGSEALVALYGQ